MDFFHAQAVARRKSKFLVFYFLAAVVAIIAAIYATVVLVLTASDRGGLEHMESVWWQPQILAVVAAGVIGLIGLGSLFKSLSLRAGGGAVARSLGGIPVDPATTDLDHKRLLNVVEEMAIASGVRVPDVYILPEQGINAFAAGFSADDAAIAVTQGALAVLTRDELQGVIAHEFSHILHGDVRLNMRLIGLLFGILLLAIIGRGILSSLGRSGGMARRSRKNGGAIALVVVVGLSLLVTGYFGVLFGRLIQAAVSRQREFLADASAVQFTRNPSGIAGALKKIGGYVARARVRNVHAAETGHMFFANALQGSAINLFSTHPPLVERIRAIEPSFDGNFPIVTSPEPGRSDSPRTSGSRRSPPPLRPEQFLGAVFAAADANGPATGAAVIASIPPSLREAVHDPACVRAVVLALLAHPDDAGGEQRQAATLATTMTPREIEAGAEAVSQLAGLSTEARLALLDLALPTLRRMPEESLRSFITACDALIAADYRVTPFEFAIRHILRRNLEAAHHPRPAGLPHPRPLPGDVAALLAAVARTGASDTASAAHAFAAGARRAGLHEERLDAVDGNVPSGLNQLTMALGRLDRVDSAQKRKLLNALAHAAAADNVLKDDELALLRAFAAALDCPAPILTATAVESATAT